MPETFPRFEILPHLFLSKFPDTIPTDITHVLNMCTQPHPLDASREYLHIPLDDIDNIGPHISAIVMYIEHALRDNGAVLVHCALGLNRSAAAIISYLCHRNGTTAKQALEFVKEKKADVQPSALFLRQIDRYFCREGKSEDPLVGFHQRLQQRKLQALADSGDSYKEAEERAQDLIKLNRDRLQPPNPLMDLRTSTAPESSVNLFGATLYKPGILYPVTRD
ncbi:Dual specificity protein phosphatase [Lachnellula occidentalis]|uniref:protein-tyrosine-phosphatase n=1 Tax=Lachnellula occidentalis TaxID=215460 RepID=A0A8H8U9B3_9HELO|nr:Dual specificity protein phosphatase [Lachnellula occidentalis]